MNTPAHIAASLLAGRKLTGWAAVSVLAGGAVLPDAMMFVFYGYQKWNGQPEKTIWNELYFTAEWQLFFDLFNSIPIFLFLAVGCYLLKFRWCSLFFASALLHVLCDLPVHNDDAHRHFLPFSHWRFISPVSYWDPKHFGIYFALFEIIFAMVACVFIGRGTEDRAVRVAAFGTLSLYVIGIAIALLFWMIWIL